MNLLLIDLYTIVCRYLFSLAYVASLFPIMLLIQPASYFINACSIVVLRSTNGFLAVICSILVHDIIKSLNPSLDDRKVTLYTVVLALYPLHWFFTFLYYTDVASLTLVLAMYLVCLKKNYLSSALVIIANFLIFFFFILLLLFKLFLNFICSCSLKNVIMVVG